MVVFFQFCGHLHTSYHVMSILHFTLACCCEPEVGVFTVLAPPSTPTPSSSTPTPVLVGPSLSCVPFLSSSWSIGCGTTSLPWFSWVVFFYCLDINSPVFCGFALLRLFLFPFFCPLFSLPCLPFSVSSQSQSWVVLFSPQCHGSVRRASSPAPMVAALPGDGSVTGTMIVPTVQTR